MNMHRATVRSYDATTGIATVEPWGMEQNIAVPVAHSVPWWVLLPGVDCVIMLFDDNNPYDGCLLACYGGRPPVDPHFDPTIGHKHRGIEDDAPTL